jgi:DNA-binding NarL/FixJ family response regulator
LSPIQNFRSMPTRTTVLIVDDHPLFRNGLRQVITDDPRFELAGETGDGAIALELIREKKPDVAVLDVNLPGFSGLEIAQQLQGKRSRTRLIILTMHKEEEIFNRALNLGVSGFILKENAVDEIVKAIITVAGDGHYLSSSVSSYLVRRRNREELLAAKKPGLEDLTKAERRILKLIAAKKPAGKSARNFSSARAPSRRTAPTSSPSSNCKAATACCSSPSKIVPSFRTNVLGVST